ncbi:multidrug effflux MFS transporter [Colwellia sp. 1_MG-2023]|uniref:multidrug effflux MFS transporter n=1 Tax=Colwellia sp. 1_MG-2023 TaxID=3062649 RepID=UPI0026E22F6E|nr:multidrug effflux MFS transporter [Colwellia sp. 1_MG-2023]MDO6445132.1 multidrug effflux MFS transporter [Colwellia sp. 1_MG-2023]
MTNSDQTTHQVSLKLLLPLLASIIALSPLAIDMYLPAMPIIAEQLSTNMSSVQNSLSIYLLGYALGLLFFGPLADKYRRRTLVMIGISGFTLVSLAIPFTTSIEQFLILRFAQAFISSAATVVVPGTIKERYGNNTAKGFSYVSMIMMVAPMIAPSIGSVLLLHSWQAIFTVLGVYSLFILTLAYRFLPEKKQAVEVGSVNFLARYKVVLGHRKSRLDLLSSMVISLAFFAFITAIPFVYLTVFKVSEFTFSFLFGINVLTLITAHFINTRLVTRKGSRTMQSYGLVVAILASSGLVVVQYFQFSLIYTVVALLPLMGSISMIAVNTDALILLEFNRESGTATAVIGTLRFGIGSLAGPILAYFYDGSALPFAMLMWGSVIVVLLCQLSHWVRNSAKS